MTLKIKLKAFATVSRFEFVPVEIGIILSLSSFSRISIGLFNNS